MSRKKQGIDYFPVDCQFTGSVKYMLAEFGLVGAGCLIRLWQKIYGEKGYYTKWDDDVALVFAQENGAGFNVVKEVVSACLRRGIFHREMFERYQILTSDGIQERFADATKRRISQKIDGRYLLIPAPKNWVDVNRNGENVDRNGENVDRMAQSRGEESRVNSFNHSFARTREECDGCEAEELQSQGALEETLGELPEGPDAARKVLNGIGKGVVLLSDVQTGDLLSRISLEEFNYYVGVIADCELSGKKYRRKTHYQAILEMAEEDRRIHHQKKENES